MKGSTWKQRFEAAVGAAAVRAHARPVLAMILCGLSLVASLYVARSLKLNADLVELLPRSFQSVRDLDRLRQRFGGIGYVVVVGRGASESKLKQFADDLAPKLEKLPGIAFVENRRPTEFFEKRALYYMDTADVRAIEERVKDRIAYEREKHSPFSLGLEEEVPSLDFSDLERKYSGRAHQRLQGSGDPYYYSPTDQLIAVLAKPAESSTDLGFARQVVTHVEHAVQSMDLSRYGPDFRWDITGTFKKKLDQQAQITSDIQRASTLALLVLMLHVMLHFRSFLALAPCLLPVVLGLGWTYALVTVAYGEVNLLTGFLGAILGGLGTEHGIHLLTRYRALLADGADSNRAIRETFQSTGASAFFAALAAALTFSALSISEFRAFREFGIIAAFGMLLAVLAFVCLFPALIRLVGSTRWRPRAAPRASAPRDLAAGLVKYHRTIFVLSLGAMAILAIEAPSVRFNHDFSALDDIELPSVSLDHAVNRVIGYSQTPVVIMTDTARAAREAAGQLEQRKQHLGEASTIDFVLSVDKLVPQNQREKHQILQRMHAELASLDPERVSAELREQFDRAVKLTSTPPFTLADLPRSLLARFEPTARRNEGLVLAYSRVSMSDAAALQRLASEVRDLPLGNGQRVSAAGESMILVDILDMVSRELPVILAAAVVLALLVARLAMGRLRTALLCLLPTMLSLVGLLGAMTLWDVPFNYLNIVVIPVFIGTTIDAGVHLMARLSSSGVSFVEVFRETGRSITGGLVASAIGFGALVMAHHPGLRSIGTLANLGFAVNWALTLVGFPAFLLWLNSAERKRESERLAVAGSTNERISAEPVTRRPNF